MELQSGGKPPHSKAWYTQRMDPGVHERSSMDDVIDIYKKDVDMTLIREALKLSPDQSVRRMIDVLAFVEQLREAMERAKAEKRAKLA